MGAGEARWGFAPLGLGSPRPDFLRKFLVKNGLKMVLKIYSPYIVEPFTP